MGQFQCEETALAGADPVQNTDVKVWNHSYLGEVTGEKHLAVSTTRRKGLQRININK